MNLRVGCCGFPVGRQQYYNRFEVVEIQKTFYQPPKIETVIKWRETAPSGFEFTLKAWQLITHPASSPTYRRLKIKIEERKRARYGFFNPTDEVFKAWDEIDKIATALKARIILFQSPASFKPEKVNIDNINEFFKKVNRKDYKFMWEPRGNWPESIINKLCKALNLIHCVDPFKARPLYGDMRYFRLHGITGYKYKYSHSDLKRLLDICASKRPTYVMFNNTNMWEDAAEFKRLSKV